MSYHDEIRELLEELPAEYEASPLQSQLREQAEKLLALPEESVEKLVQAAQLGVEAVEIALGTVTDGIVTAHEHS